MRVHGWRLAWLGGLATGLMVIAFAATARATVPDYGVSPQNGAVPSRAEIEEMAAGGVKQIRLLLHWGTVESTRGTYNWSGIDATVRETANYGVKPFFFIYGTPTWAAKLDGRKGCKKKDCSVYPPIRRRRPTRTSLPRP
jgi:hypothetical protein